MERRARSTPPPGGEQHGLKMVPKGSESSAISGDAAAAHGGQRGGAEGTALVDVPRPTHLPLDFGQPARDPQGLLAPLVRGAPGDGRALQADQGQVGHSGQVQHGDQGGRAQVNDRSVTRRGTETVNPFWSSDVRRNAPMSGQGRLPGDVGLTRNLQPAMDAAGSGRTGQDLDEGELERIRQRILRDFKLEIRKLRGEVGIDPMSYHSASSGGDQGAPSAAQGDRAASGPLQLHFGGLVMAWQRCQLLYYMGPCS